MTRNEAPAGTAYIPGDFSQVTCMSLILTSLSITTFIDSVHIGPFFADQRLNILQNSCMSGAGSAASNKEQGAVILERFV